MGVQDNLDWLDNFQLQEYVENHMKENDKPFRSEQPDSSQQRMQRVARGKPLPALVNRY